MIFQHVPFTIRTSFLVLTGRRRRALWLAFSYWRRFKRAKLHPVMCAWCQRTKQQGNPALPTSHGICQSCRIEHFRYVPLAA